MTTDDLKQIRTVIREEVGIAEKGLTEEIGNTESRLEKRIESEIKSVKQDLEAKIEESRKSIIREVGEFIEDTILPQIDEKLDKTYIERLERKADSHEDKLLDHEKRIKDLESASPVAHQIKK